MKKMQIFKRGFNNTECCCQNNNDGDRFFKVLKTLKSRGVRAECFDYDNVAEEFEKNEVINDFLKNNPDKDFLVTLIDNEVKVVGRYPTNEELLELLSLPEQYLQDHIIVKEAPLCVKGPCCCG